MLPILLIFSDRTYFLSCRPRLKPSLFDGWNTSTDGSKWGWQVLLQRTLIFFMTIYWFIDLSLRFDTYIDTKVIWFRKDPSYCEKIWYDTISCDSVNAVQFLDYCRHSFSMTKFAKYFCQIDRSITAYLQIDSSITISQKTREFCHFFHYMTHGWGQKEWYQSYPPLCLLLGPWQTENLMPHVWTNISDTGNIKWSLSDTLHAQVPHAGSQGGVWKKHEEVFAQYCNLLTLQSPSIYLSVYLSVYFWENT